MKTFIQNAYYLISVILLILLFAVGVTLTLASTTTTGPDASFYTALGLKLLGLLLTVFTYHRLVALGVIKWLSKL